MSLVVELVNTPRPPTRDSARQEAAVELAGPPLELGFAPGLRARGQQIDARALAQTASPRDRDRPCAIATEDEIMRRLPEPAERAQVRPVDAHPGVAQSHQQPAV